MRNSAFAQSRYGLGAEATNNDDKGFLTFCATIGSLIALSMLVLSIYGIIDATNETSLKKAA